MASGQSDCIRGAITRATRLTGPQRAAILLAAASAILWAILIAGLWATIPPRVLHLVQPGSATATLAAVVIWIGTRNGRRAEASSLLIGTVDRLTRPASRTTGPLRLHRVP